MRRIVIIGALVGIGCLIVRSRIPKLHERLMARCEGMFEQMSGHTSAHRGDEGQRQNPCGGGTPSEPPRGTRVACVNGPSTEGAAATHALPALAGAPAGPQALG